MNRSLVGYIASLPEFYGFRQVNNDGLHQGGKPASGVVMLNQQLVTVASLFNIMQLVASSFLQ